MHRFALLLLLSANLSYAGAGVDIDTAASVYQAAGVREQVRISLGSMGGKMRRLFASDASGSLNESQLAAVEASAVRGFRIGVFEPPALAALADGLDAPTCTMRCDSCRVPRAGAWSPRISQRHATMRRRWSSFRAANPSPGRATSAKSCSTGSSAASHTVESAVQIYLTIARGLAIGTAMGSGRDPIAAAERVDHNADADVRASLATSMQEPARRSLAYGYRDLSTADLQALLSFLKTRAGERYISAYMAAMNAGFDAMSRRCGERIGDSWRELAVAQQSAAPHTPAPAPAAPVPAQQ